MEIVIELDRKKPIKELNRWNFYAMYKRQSKKDKENYRAEGDTQKNYKDYPSNPEVLAI